jgi:hypothetical protein
VTHVFALEFQRRAGIQCARTSSVRVYSFAAYTLKEARQLREAWVFDKTYARREVPSSHKTVAQARSVGRITPVERQDESGWLYLPSPAKRAHDRAVELGIGESF